MKKMDVVTPLLSLDILFVSHRWFPLALGLTVSSSSRGRTNEAVLRLSMDGRRKFKMICIYWTSRYLVLRREGQARVGSKF